MKKKTQAAGEGLRHYARGLQLPFRREGAADQKSKRTSKPKKQGGAEMGERSASMASPAMAGC